MFEGIVAIIPDLAPLLVNLSIFIWIIFIFGAILLFLPSLSDRSWVKKLRETYGRFVKNRKALIKKTFIVLVVLQIVILLVLFQVDTETKVHASEKIVIIEIDDFWNLQSNHFAYYGYSMENYESVIGIIEKHNFTATLAVSPYIFIEDDQDILALREDDEMVRYLKEKKKKGYEIAMHGYAHCQNKTYCPEYEENYLNILQGKREIDQLFDQDTITYLPPGNFWKDPKYYNVINTGFLITGNTHVDKPYWDSNVLITQRGYDVVKEWDWYGAEYEYNDYEDWIKAYDESEFFIIQLHCNTFDSQEKLDDLDRFLEFLEKENVKVVTYQEAYEMLKE